MTLNVEEIHSKKEELVEKFDGKLPSYLKDYFDTEEEKILRTESFVKANKRKYSFTPEERREYAIQKQEEFWKENKTEIVKRPKPINTNTTPVYTPVDGNKNRFKEEEVELSPDEIKVLVDLCEDNLYLFAIRYFSHYLKKPSSKLHKTLYKTFSRELNKKNRTTGFKWAIAAPRGNAKSSLLSIITPLWCLCYNKKKFIIIISNTASLAEDFLTDIKLELETNSALIRDFPHVCNKGPRWRSNEIITNNDVKLMALGTGSQIRGRKYGTNRPDLIIGDDLEDKDMVRSPTTLDFVKNTWFAKDVMFAGGEEGSPVDFIVIGTILSKDSLLNSLLDPQEYPEWNGQRFKSIYKFSVSPLWDKWKEIFTDVFNVNRIDDAKVFFEEHKEEMLEGTEVLWPEGKPYYGLYIEYVKDISSFMSELQNDPKDPTKILVLKEDLKFIDFRSPEILKILRRGYFYGALDPSLGKKKVSGDYSCICTILRDPKTGLLFVIDINLARRTVDDQIKKILDLYKAKFRWKIFGIETNAFQLVVAENLRKLSKSESLYIPIKELNNYNDKKMRVESIVPLIKDGTIIFDSHKYKNVAMYNTGVEQLLSFTGEGDMHDDFPDALEMSVRIAREKVFRRTTKQTK